MTRKTKVATEETDESEDLEEEESKDDKGPQANSGGNAGADNLESHIRTVVTETLNSLLGSRDKPPATSAGQDEQSIRKMVRDAQDELKKEEARDSKIGALGESVEAIKKVVERAPARAGVGGRIQCWLWGSE